MTTPTRRQPTRPTRPTARLAQVRRQIAEAVRIEPRDWRQRAGKARLLQRLYAIEAKARPKPPPFDPDFDYPF